jgi:glycine/D-amino acid oxidase-like deaminating enzyme
MIKIAILGAGFCGLATAWMLKQNLGNLANSITLFDPLPIGKGTSGIAAGLLHPFVGLHANLNPFGFEGFAATSRLIEVAEKQLGHSVVFGRGFLRLAYSDSQRQSYRKTSEQYPDYVQWMESEEVAVLMPQASPASGIFIHSAMTVDTSEYLKGLWLACQSAGIQLHQRKIEDLEELADFDHIVAATGADTTKLAGLENVSIRRTKGQLLEVRWPDHIPALRHAINSQVYCLMGKDQKHAIVGATYEKEFESELPDIEIARNLLLPKLGLMLPGLQQSEIIACRSGVRASTPNRLPLVTQISKRLWLISGMGSRGLLYHAIYAQRLAELMKANLAT